MISEKNRRVVRTFRVVPLIRGYFLLSRPLNVAIVVISVAIGSFLSGRFFTAPVLLACVSAGLILAGGNYLNDVFDLETDLVNNPERPIPSGRATRRGASISGGVLLLVGTFLSVPVGPVALAVAASASLLLVLYGMWLKRLLLVGNILVSFLAALAFVYGGVAAGSLRRAWFPAVFAFLFHMGREVIKDAEDVKGDKQSGVRSLAVVFGVRAGLTVAALVFVLLLLVTVVPFALGDYGYAYLWLIVFGVDLLLVITMTGLLAGRGWMSLHLASSLIKAGMVIGLVALAVSGV